MLNPRVFTDVRGCGGSRAVALALGLVVLALGACAGPGFGYRGEHCSEADARCPERTVCEITAEGCEVCRCVSAEAFRRALFPGEERAPR